MTTPTDNPSNPTQLFAITRHNKLMTLVVKKIEQQDGYKILYTGLPHELAEDKYFIAQQRVFESILFHDEDDYGLDTSKAFFCREEASKAITKSLELEISECENKLEQLRKDLKTHVNSSN